MLEICLMLKKKPVVFIHTTLNTVPKFSTLFKLQIWNMSTGCHVAIIVKSCVIWWRLYYNMRTWRRHCDL